VKEVLESFESPLSECQSGEEGEVISVDTDTTLAARLRELGIVPGARVRVSRAGSPLIVEVGSARLCLRGEEASRVLMRVAMFPEAAHVLGGVALERQGLS
jgi:Fe2+ transport system protein FeoA